MSLTAPEIARMELRKDFSCLLGVRPDVLLAYLHVYRENDQRHVSAYMHKNKERHGYTHIHTHVHTHVYMHICMLTCMLIHVSKQM